MSDITITRAGRIAAVSFDRGTPANPPSVGLMRDLTAVARSFGDDASLSAVILTGRADNFCLGFDLRDAQTQVLPQIPLAERRLALQVGARMCRASEKIEALTIAAIDGWCVGGGVALAVSLDLRIAAPSSTVYVPEVERGLNMSWGSIPRITNLIGPARAKRVIVLAEQVGATQAEHWGLLDGVARDGAVRAAARAKAEKAAGLPPVALRMCKQGINAYANALARLAGHSDFDQFALAHASEDAAEGIAAFLQKRDPRFSGR